MAVMTSCYPTGRRMDPPIGKPCTLVAVVEDLLCKWVNFAGIHRSLDAGLVPLRYGGRDLLALVQTKVGRRLKCWDDGGSTR